MFSFQRKWLFCWKKRFDVLRVCSVCSKSIAKCQDLLWGKKGVR